MIPAIYSRILPELKTSDKPFNGFVKAYTTAKYSSVQYHLDIKWFFPNTPILPGYFSLEYQASL